MLREKAIALGARFGNFQDVEAVAEYGRGAAAEYVATRKSVGLMDRSAMGRIELSGADRSEFLQRMSTNDMRLVKEGHGNQTVLTTPEAHIIELLTVYPKGETLLCVTNPQNRAKVFDWFRRNIFFRDKVKPRDVSAETTQLTLFGPRATELLASFGVHDLTAMAPYECRPATINGVEVLLGRVPMVAGGGFDLISEFNSADVLWDALMEAGQSHSISPLGTIAYDMLRIEAGVPVYGFELNESVNPLEAGLNHSISFAKGCYTGQEVIARLDTYQRLKQRLARFALSGLPVGELPLPLWSANSEVGHLTSVAQLPDSTVVGLGYVRAKAFAQDAHYNVGADQLVEAALLAPVVMTAQVAA